MDRPFLGILALDTNFPRIKGDVGNPDSYPFPVVVEVVTGADSPDIVRDGMPADWLLKAFIAKARVLEERGAAAIISTCGFLVNAQTDIASAVKIPVLLSALSLFSLALAACPGRIGILTASDQALGHNTLTAAGISPELVAVAGLEDVPKFAETFLEPREKQATELDYSAIENAVVARAIGMQKANPDLSAFILECGNLPPYANAVKQATGLPVFHLVGAASLLMEAS
ncbi:aspartate/glutamate racemase family protein [Profundibacter sp.]|uniref:aspartate/glutamate racemase family protein n=1 Tax=Profundibacter sp. TaxID=3101071 RepID=UPI003D137F8A